MVLQSKILSEMFSKRNKMYKLMPSDQSLMDTAQTIAGNN